TAEDCRLEFLDSGDFVANCPGCRKRRKWLLDEARPAAIRRRFAPTFQSRFCLAVAEGLPLRAPEPLTYLRTESGDWDDRLLAHRLQSEIDGSQKVVYLPRSAVIHVREAR